MPEASKLGAAKAAVREAERLIGLAEREERFKDADANRRTLLIPALYAALQAAAPAGSVYIAEAAEAFAEAYSQARYGWSLSDFDAGKARLVRGEAAALLAFARSGQMHKTLFDAGIPIER